MSFILDALKKSEIDRQRQAVPGLIDVPATRRRRRLPWWAFALGALLLVNVGVLMVLLLRNPSPKPPLARNLSTPASPAAPEAQRADAPASPPPAKDDHFSPMDSAPVYAPEIPVQSAPGAGDRPAPPPVDVQPQTPPRAVHRDPVLSEAPPPDENDEVLPTLSQLTLPGGQTLPDMHIDVHVYGTKAAERFVYINMRKYREGQTLQEGPVLERIRRDGAVLNYKGVRFLLPRQS